MLAGIGGQIAVLWAAVLIAKSDAFEPFRNRGPGSVGDLLLISVLIVALDVVLAGALALVLRRRRWGRTVRWSVFAVIALIGIAVVVGFGLL
ncbi:hypothetical protein [Micromonospora zhanjiangensis]|uniref:Uncharacterized protein n=1 Tax=Micromonospora zhanjiangensis TaxID=1522057 RepID=A0ABV8KXK0_9ACTN